MRVDLVFQRGQFSLAERLCRTGVQPYVPARNRIRLVFLEEEPGVFQTGENRYQVVMLGQAWSFTPNEVRVPAGAEVTFLVTSTDVIHGFNIEDTRVNAMLIPGQVARVTYTFREPGEHLIVCHEYCGLNHHMMWGRVIVE